MCVGVEGAADGAFVGAFVGDTLRLALGAYEYGMVVLNEQVDGRPAEYSFNSTWFPGSTLSFS